MPEPSDPACSPDRHPPPTLRSGWPATGIQCGVIPAKVEQLSDQDRQLVRLALAAAVESPCFPDWEFQTLMAADRTEVAAVLDAWPEARVAAEWEPDPERLQAVVVGNVLNNLLGYPHGQWEQLELANGLDREAVRELLGRWRAE